MQQTDYLQNKNYQYWKDSSNQYWVSKDSDQTKLSGPYSSIDQIPSTFSDSDFVSHNLTNLTQIPSSQISSKTSETSKTSASSGS